MTFKLLWGFDALVALVFLWFFVVGLADGSVSSFNMGLWLGILGGLGGLLFGSWKLRSAGRTASAAMLLLVVAVPSAGFGLLMLSILLLNPDFK